jgi:pyruvate dehydrogenase E1 component beta subunit
MSVSVGLSYFDELCNAMAYLGALPNTVFLGQGVGCAGTSMSQTFAKVPSRKCIEMPVAEESQMGMAIGMSLMGDLPICIFPRWNFVPRAADQLINHLDRLPLYSGYRPKVIIRVAVPSKDPFYAGPQHDDDFSEAFAMMLRTVEICRLTKPEHIMPVYKAAAEVERSSIIVEHTEFYRNARATE